MPPTKAITAPLEIFRRLPDGKLKNQLRAVGFSVFGTPRYHPRIQLPRKHLLVNPGDTAVLIGTPNPGRVDLFGRLTGTDGRVIIFEANPENHEMLSAAASGSDFDHVEIDPRAVHENNGSIELQIPAEGAGDGQVVTEDSPEAPYEFTRTETVPCGRLDDLLEDLNANPDFIEVMINGAEPDVLRGADDILSNPGPRLLLKSFGYGVFDDHRRTEMIELLETHDYEIAESPVRNDVPHPGATDGDLFAWK